MLSKRKPARNHILTKSELQVLRYVVTQLQACYSVNGRPKLSRNMNQVMLDIFGVKKFTRTLEQGCRNEQTMANLIDRIGLDKLFTLCRSREHYQMLSTLVCIDHEIVELQKKQQKIVDMSPESRPTAKYKKNEKELKKLLKAYKGTVKTFRYILDVRTVKNAGKYSNLIATAKNWRDTYEYGFYDDGYGASIFDDVESMEDFVTNQNDRRRGERRRGDGIFDELDSEDELIGGFRHRYDEDEEEDEDPEEAEDRMATKISTAVVTALADNGFLGPLPQRQQPTRQKAAPRSGSGNKDLAARVDGIEAAVGKILQILQDDYLEEDEDDDDGGYSSEIISTGNHVTGRPKSHVVRPVRPDGEDVGIPIGDIDRLNDGEEVDGIPIEHVEEGGDDST